ncbi:hypothetical protein [Pseudooceanicola nitratireducens]|uniref:hypothetical protein n=1 Tax=Pseudooceanicola nitratireducens TaxID=517719 RepID=UPI001C989B3F|nr:hypothetical protein [Pseudooceanicola nitratireducens]MBY6157955.1 hypothetical protein [Pseudooceanicola nitratireducens]
MDNLLIQTLRDQEDYATFAKGLRHETNRGAVLVATSALDSLLKALLMTKLDTSEMSSDQKQDLGNSIKNFTSKVALAHAMGLIGKSEAKALIALNEVRNKLAHKWDASFEDKNIQLACEKLPLEFLDTLEKTESETAYDRFKFQIDIMLRDLIARVGRIKLDGEITAFSEKSRIDREHAECPW